MLTVARPGPGVGSLCGAEVGAAERAVGFGWFGLVGRGWNVAGAASVEAPVVRADRATGLGQGNGPGC